MSNTGKKPLVFAAALICIIMYAAALIYGAVRIYVNYNERVALADIEFDEIADRASSAAVVNGFMTAKYQVEIQETLMDSQTLLGVIITGSNGEFSFERQNGSVIEWFGDNPRFKPGFGISGNPYYKGIYIEGQRNTSIRAIYSYLDYDLFIQVLKDTLYIVLLIIAFAVLVLILDLNFRTAQNLTPARAQSKPETPPQAYRSQPDEIEESLSEETWDEPELPETDDLPKGLYTHKGIGWESYTIERLESELHRCAALEEDLVLIVIEARNAKFGDETFKKLADETIKFFTQRDMIFEKGEQGICLIIPALNLDQGFAKSEEFRSKVQGSLIDPSGVPPYICIGLSSRAGRLVEADRLLFEASQALQKAKKDPDSPIIAFKSDPEKYREFISRKMKAS